MTTSVGYKFNIDDARAAYDGSVRRERPGKVVVALG
jgi:hypothetical protein